AADRDGGSHPGRRRRRLRSAPTLRAVRSGVQLGAIESGTVALLREEGRPRRFRSGATLFHEGDHSDWIGLVLKGRVKVSCYGADGRERLVAVVGPGELLGELAAIDGEPRSATATALEPIDLAVLTSDEFVALL